MKYNPLMCCIVYHISQIKTNLLALKEQMTRAVCLMFVRLCLPTDLADLPLVKFDFSCNKVSTIPVCYRKMKQLQTLQLENNPLQSPPAQVHKQTHTHFCLNVLYIFHYSLCLSHDST